jgi:hypothetical protein
VHAGELCAFCVDFLSTQECGAGEAVVHTCHESWDGQGHRVLWWTWLGGLCTNLLSSAMLFGCWQRDKARVIFDIVSWKWAHGSLVRPACGLQHCGTWSKMSIPLPPSEMLPGCQGAVTHAYNPSYLGGWDQEDCSSRPKWGNSSWDSHLQNNQSKMDLEM